MGYPCGLGTFVADSFTKLSNHYYDAHGIYASNQRNSGYHQRQHHGKYLLSDFLVSRSQQKAPYGTATSCLAALIFPYSYLLAFAPSIPSLS